MPREHRRTRRRSSTRARAGQVRRTRPPPPGVDRDASCRCRRHLGHRRPARGPASVTPGALLPGSCRATPTGTRPSRGPTALRKAVASALHHIERVDPASVGCWVTRSRPVPCAATTLTRRDLCTGRCSATPFRADRLRIVPPRSQVPAAAMILPTFSGVKNAAGDIAPELTLAKASLAS